MLCLAGVSLAGHRGHAAALISPAQDERAAAAAQAELAALARALHAAGTPAAYARLSEFAARHAGSEAGARARLALGYHDLSAKRHEQALAHLEAAEAGAVLREYAVWWQAQALRALGRHDRALARLEAHRGDYPQSASAEAVLAALGESAIASAQPARGLAALEAYPPAASRPALLWLRAQLRERLNQPEEAAADYIALHYRHALSNEGRQAAAKLRELRDALGARFPAVPLELRAGRAAALFNARRWAEARSEYADLAGRLAGVEREQALLRAAISRAQSGGGPAPLAALQLSDAELDAERLFELSQAYRRQRNEAAMLAAIEQAARQYPQARGTEQALFSGGNYFVVNLERRRAAEFYRRMLAAFPEGSNAQLAQWRVAWAAYLDGAPETAALFEEHLRRFPGSPMTENALYWLGRTAQREGNVAHARTFYRKAAERFPNSYYGMQAAARLKEIGAEGPLNESEVIALIPPPPPLRLGEAPLPSGALPWRERALALAELGFDALAETELRAGHAATRAVRLLLEAARAAQNAGRFLPSISAARSAVPQLEQRPMGEVPEDIWRLVYPLAYREQMLARTRPHDLDPMLVAGLIRQESVFSREAVSRAGAVGLMQIMPATGRMLARQLGVPYARASLFNPDYNLRLGTRYLATLLNRYGLAEKALAAYNAGEHRVELWKTEREFAEPAEFVECIPFTETREYVQIVIRNAEIYRRLYGAGL